AGAGLLGVIAWRDWRPVPAPTVLERWPGLALPWDRARALRLVGIGLAGALAAAADAAFLADPTPTFGLAGLLWLAAMALLVWVTATWPDQNAERGMRNAELDTDANDLPARTEPSPRGRGP